MQEHKRRLLKDLPFGNLKKDSVIVYINNSYRINNGDTYYKEGGSSSNGISIFDESEENILNAIWDNPEWFEDAVLEHIDFIPSNTSITLRFKAMDIEDVETLTKGLIHILDHLEDDNYTWNNFKAFTTKIINN